MMEDHKTQRPDTLEERYRLYIDESGDHVFRYAHEESHRYLCLLGVWFRTGDYRRFHANLEFLKQDHFPHSPDDSPVLHREDLIGARKRFVRLRQTEARRSFDAALLQLLSCSEFRMTGVVIDKFLLQEKYPTPAHPYHLALGFLLQRYCGYLNHFNRRGDVMAESRGGVEDRLLKDSYDWVYRRGAWQRTGAFFQEALTSKELKLKPKTANISGLQLADLLASPVRQMILSDNGRLPTGLPAFTKKIQVAVEDKFNRHLYDGRVEGYGKVLFPRQTQ